MSNPHPSDRTPSGRGDVDAPAWVRDAVFYQIFPDRFARSGRVPKPSGLEPWDAPPTVHGYKGGDLLGVAERLEHLERLGVNALYLNPVFRSASNHRYHTHDYHVVDPMLGGNEALRELLDAAHARGMRVVLDGVFNHASRGFFQFSDILENGTASAYLDWFRVRAFPLNAYGGGELGYDAWWDLPALPEFDTDTPAVREFLWDVAVRWLEFGIDGWRLDVPNEIDDDEFWREFRRRCRAADPECYLVGEIWGDADRWLRGDQFDAVMNYPFTRAVAGFAALDVDDAQAALSGYRQIPLLDGPLFAKALRGLARRYGPAATRAQLNLLGSHDTPRLLTLLRGDRDAVRLAVTVQMTWPGAPCVYYGDEIGLEGGHDPACRASMPWDDETAWDEGLFEHHRALIALRRSHEALRGGDVRVLGGAAGVVAYARRGAGEVFVVVANADEAEAPLDLPLDPPFDPSREGDAPEAWSGPFVEALGAGSARAALSGSRLTGDPLPPRSARVLRRVR